MTDDKELLRRAAKAPATTLPFVLEWAGIARNTCSRDGRKDSAKLWADAIEHLEYQAARIEELKSALRPFAKDAPMWSMVSDDHRPKFHQLAGEPDPARFTVGDLRRAAAALGGKIKPELDDADR